MTGIQLTRPQAAGWTQPAAQPAESPTSGRHASTERAKLSIKRMFYRARHGD